MADSSRPSVAKSSMIDLKAELFRKQEEYKQLKSQNAADFVKGRKSEQHGKKSLWSKQNAGVEQRASKDLEQKEEEDNVMERSRKALEAKSKIYEKIASASGIPDEDGSEGFLVDFQRKAVDRIVEERRSEKVTSVDPGKASDDDDVNDEPFPAPSDPEEEWVDYVDTFGRSRRCMKKDLPRLETQERPLGGPPSDVGLKLKEGATLLSADMKRELRRQQWEKEAQEHADGPLHYSNVQFDEIRSHGTGFYQFSKDSNLREEQMEMLNKLREQTTDSRQRSEKIKEKRKAALESRLAKVKQRRKMKGGSSMETEEDVKPVEEEINQGAKKEEESKEPEPLTRDNSWRSSAPVREWDKGKEQLPEWNAKRYMNERRGERETEFAPPQFYFDKQPGAKTSSSAGYTSRIGQKNHAGNTQESTDSSAGRNTDALLKQIRNSAGASSSQVPEPPVLGDVKASVGESVNRAAATAVKYEPDIDPTAIPLPEDMVTGTQPCSTFGQNAQGRGDRTQFLQQAQPFPTATQGHFQGQEYVQSQSHDYFQGQGQGHIQGQENVQSQSQYYFQDQGHIQGQEYVHSQSQDYCQGQGHFEGQGQFQPVGPQVQMGDFSTPPPGWCPPQSNLIPPPAGPAAQSAASASSPWPAHPSVHAQQSTAAASFRYPSQQGLLNPQPLQTSSLQHTVPPPTAKPTATKLSEPAQKATAPKLNMVDKRFMQNREVSEEDLLGYMAGASADRLATVEAVPYTPGIFTSAASTQKAVKVETPEEYVSGGEVSAAQDTSRSSGIPEAKTEGVIFGVPEFLQPASNVAAETYQPGSFMAAKEAAAKRAEEDYEVARKKKQYSSAPVLYGMTDNDVYEEQEVKYSVPANNTEKSEVTGTDGGSTDDELSKFLKEMRGGK